MEIEEQVKKNSGDIQELTVQMTRLATIVEHTEKSREKDGIALHEVATSITQMNEKISSALSMAKDIVAIRETLSERTQELGGIRHDVKNLIQSMQAIPLLKEKVSEMDKTQGILENEVVALKKWRDQLDGGGKAIKAMAIVFWAVFGSVITGGIIWLVNHFTGVKISGE